MKNQTSVLTLVLSFSLLCGSAFAQTERSVEYREWEVTPFVGASFIPSAEFSTPVFADGQASSTRVGMSFDPGYSIGMRIHQNLREHWGADLEYSFANQRLNFTNLSPNVQNLSLNSYIHHVSYDIASLPLSRRRRFRPYGDAGIGFVGYLPGSGNDAALERGVDLHDSWLFLFNWGGGLKYLLADGLAVTFDAKDRISSFPSFGLPKSARIVNGFYEPGISRHGILQNWQLNLGFSLQWDEF